MKVSYVMSVAFFLVGCDNAARFDGTNLETLHSSAQKVSEQLSDEKREKLRLAIADELSFYQTEAILKNNKSYSPDKTRMFILDGKTADQIIFEAKLYRGKKEKLLIQSQQEPGLTNVGHQ